MTAFLIALAGLVSVASPAHADEEATYVKSFGTSDPGRVAYAWDVAVGPDGNVYVTDGNASRVVVFTADGEYVRTISGHMVNPLGVDVDDDGAVYVSSTNNTVSKFAADGTFVFEVPTHALHYGYGIAVDDASGHIYVADTHQSRVVRLAADGSYLSTWGSPGSGPGQFNNLYGIAVDDEGVVYVPDFGNNRIQKFTSNGTFISQLAPTSGDGLRNPIKIDVDSAGRIAVGEYSRPGATVMTAEGDVVASWRSHGVVEDDIYGGAAGIAFGADDTVFTTDISRPTGVQKYQLGPVFAAFTPQIAGSGRVGDELTASASTSPEPASWTYAWTVEGSTEVRSEEATFTPTAADQGKTATVTVTAQGTDGEPRDRTATATKAITGKLMDASAFTLSDSTPTTPPSTGDVLTLEVDEAKLPEDACGRGPLGPPGRRGRLRRRAGRHREHHPPGRGRRCRRRPVRPRDLRGVGLRGLHGHCDRSRHRGRHVHGPDADGRRRVAGRRRHPDRLGRPGRRPRGRRGHGLAVGHAGRRRVHRDRGRRPRPPSRRASRTSRTRCA